MRWSGVCAVVFTVVWIVGHTSGAFGGILDATLVRVLPGAYTDAAVDSEGRFYLLDSDRAVVKVLRPEREELLTAFDLLDTERKRLKDAVSLCILADGSMAVLDGGGNRVVLYGLEGLPRAEFPVDSGDPQSIAADAFRRLLVLDGEGSILVFGIDGLYQGPLGTVFGEGRFFEDPQGLSCDGNGNVFVLSGEEGRLHVLNPLGQAKETPLASEHGSFFLEEPRDVHVDLVGLVYLCDSELDRCLVYSKEGYLGTFGARGVGRGLFSEPVCVASDGRGVVVVGDVHNNVAQFFRVTGMDVEDGGVLPNRLLPPRADVVRQRRGSWEAAAWSPHGWAAVRDGRLFSAAVCGGAEIASATLRDLSERSRLAWGSSGSVWLVDPEQREIWSWNPDTGTPNQLLLPGKSFAPVDVTVHSSGDLLVGDRKSGGVAVFDSHDTYVGHLVEGMSRPVALAAFGETTVWVAFENGTLAAINTEDGSIQSSIDLERADLGRIRDLDTDAAGNVVVLAQRGAAVIAPTAAPKLVIGDRTRGILRWDDPTSLAMAQGDTLWVFEPSLGRHVAFALANVATGALAGELYPPHRATVWAVTGGERVASADVVPPTSSFTITGLLPREYSIDVEGPGLITLRDLGQASVSPGRIWDLGRWELKKAAIVAGRLVPPDAGVSVVLEGEESCTALSGDGGSLLFEGVAPGTYHLQVTRDGFLPYHGDALLLAAGDSTWIGDVVLTNTGAMELDVVAPGAETLWANLWSSPGGWTSHSGPGGEPLLIEDLSPGVYRVVITAPGFHPDSSFSEVALGEGELKVLSQLQLTPFPGESGNWFKTVDQGVRAYERADFPSAVSYLERAVASERLSYEDHARALLYLGLAAVALGEDAKATAAFREMCLVSPGCTLPPEYSSARLEALLEQSRPFQ